jgi:hypothetical protein
MSLKSLLKTIGKVLPAIVANAPAVIAAVKEVRQAAKTPPKPKAGDAAAAPAATGPAGAIASAAG